MTSHNYLHHIKFLAFVGIGIDLIVSVASIIFLWYYSCMPKIIEARKDKSGPFTCFKGFGKVKFIATEIILNFGLHLTDSITSKKLEKLMWVISPHWTLLFSFYDILGAYYFGRLESKLFLVHMHPNVINSMAAFVFLAIAKEIFIALIARKEFNNSYYCNGTRSFGLSILIFLSNK